MNRLLPCMTLTVLLSGCAPDLSTEEASARTFLKALNGGSSEALTKLMPEGAISDAAVDCEKRQSWFLTTMKKAGTATEPPSLTPKEAELSTALGVELRKLGAELLLLDCQRIAETNWALARFLAENGEVELLAVISSEKLKRPDTAGILVVPHGGSKEQADTVVLGRSRGKWLVTHYQTELFAELMANGAAEAGKKVPAGNLWYGLPNIRRHAVEMGFKPPRTTPVPEIPQPLATQPATPARNEAVAPPSKDADKSVPRITVEIGEPEVRGDRSPQDVMREVRTALPQLRQCVEGLSDIELPGAGKIVVRVQITVNGVVADADVVQVVRAPDSVAACMKSRLREHKFSKVVSMDSTLSSASVPITVARVGR